MRRILAVGIAFVLILTCSHAFAEAGPPIPVPKVSIDRALELSRAALKEDFADSDAFKSKDMIVLSVLYKNYAKESEYYDDYAKMKEKAFLEKYRAQWAWEIVFVHPVANDISYTYKVSQDGKVQLVEQTE